MFKTIGIAALASVVALIVGFGAHGTTTPTAHAETTDVVVIGCEFIAGAIDGNNNDGIPTNADVATACGGDSGNAVGFGTALTATDVANLADAIGDEDGTLEASDFRGDDFDENWDDNQISTDCHFDGASTTAQWGTGQACTLVVFVFVNDEGPVTIDLPSGIATKENGNLDFTCTRDVGFGPTATFPVLPATNAITATSGVTTPITVTVADTTGLTAGNVVTISGVLGQSEANGQWEIANVTATTFDLVGSVGVAAYTSGGTVTVDTDGVADMRVDNDCADGTNAALGDDTNGDGVVVFHILVDDAAASAGDVKTVNVKQEDVAQTFDVNVVGPANDVKLTLAESLIETNGNDSNADDCQTDTSVTDAISPPTSTLAWAVVTDQDDTPLTRVPVTFSVQPPEDHEVARLGIGSHSAHEALDASITGNTFFSLDPEDPAAAPTAAYIVVCGGISTGEATVRAEINLISCSATGCLILSSKDKSEQDITTGGAPSANVLTAEASTIKCDGTEKSTVTAKVTDSEGNDVADGVPVNFSVVALGTANPINTETVDGSASSVITPLSNSSAGVTVIVTAGDDSIADVVQTSVRVDCALPLATQPVVAPTPRGGIGGPDTGNGGYLNQDGASGFPMWTLVALMLGSVTLVAGGLVTRRAGK